MERIYKLYIFDMNGTLTNTPFIDKVPLAILPGRAEKLAELKSQGARLTIATNQDGVAFGFTTEAAAMDEVSGIVRTLNMDTYRIAFGHHKPKYGYEEYASPEHLSKRKPEPGMLISLMKEFRVNALNTLMVGDRDEDQEAAHKAQCNFMWSKDFFCNYDELLATTFQLFRSLADVISPTPIALSIKPDGSGYVHWTALNSAVDWERLEEAPGKLEAEIKDCQAHLKERQEAARSDDFDPFLDSDELP